MTNSHSRKKINIFRRGSRFADASNCQSLKNVTATAKWLAKLADVSGSRGSTASEFRTLVVNDMNIWTILIFWSEFVIFRRLYSQEIPFFMVLLRGDVNYRSRPNQKILVKNSLSNTVCFRFILFRPNKFEFLQKISIWQ